jgi:hypothetical protein
VTLPYCAVCLQGAAQNRAVDGDQVALHILPLAQWHHMRGGALPSGDLFATPVSDPPLRRLRSASQSGYCPLATVPDHWMTCITAACAMAAYQLQSAPARSMFGCL